MFGSIIDLALSPVKNAIDLLEGLTEGELREKAALKLGVYIVTLMSLSEVIDYLQK